MSQNRNYGIDLLRLIFMFMVCMLHTLGQGGVLNASVQGTLGHKIFWFLEILSYCAVDGFALISGYMAADKPLRTSKIVNMWFQAFFYSFVVTFFFAVVGFNVSFRNAIALSNVMPVTFRYFWYFSAYFALFFVIPVLNKFIFTINENAAKKAFLVFMLLFSVVDLFRDPFSLQGGYSFIWLVILYCIGALAKKIRLFEKKKSRTLILLWAFCIFFTWGVYVFTGNDRYISYLSPTILLSGILMVVLFSRLQLKGTLISKLSPLAFGIYLFQTNHIFWKYILEDALVFVVSENLAIGVLYIFAFALALFVFGLIVEGIRSQIAKLLRIPFFSKKITDLADKLLEKAFVFLK